VRKNCQKTEEGGIERNNAPVKAVSISSTPPQRLPSVVPQPPYLSPVDRSVLELLLEVLDVLERSNERAFAGELIAEGGGTGGELVVVQVGEFLQ
jgi:hypothetical protein